MNQIHEDKDFIVQNILFPTEGSCGDVEMYFKGYGFNVTDDEVIFKTGGTLLSSTYFNSFSISKWKRYAGVDNLKLKLDLKGKFKLSIYSMRIKNKNVMHTLLSEMEIVNSGTIRCDIPEFTDSILYFGLVALEDECIFKGGYYVTNLGERIPNRVKLAIGICTFKREEYIMANLERLNRAISDPDTNLYGCVKVFVSDNGQTLPIDQLNNDYIHIVYNKNLGGAGGFTRCLIEALHVDDKEHFTNFIFLDDDIVLSIHAIERNISLLSLLLPEHMNSVIGGAMFSTDERYLQFESAAKWQRTGFVFNRRDVDMRDNINIVLNEQEYDVNYNAWCYCCIPFNVVTKNNLPLPIFFHMDDVEYGLRNKLPIITLNGINVWHLYKKALVNAKNDYYDVRNKLIMLSEIDPGAVTDMAYIYLNAFTKEALKYHYALALNAFKGILDFCKGFNWFKHLDTEKMHGRLFNNVKWGDAKKDTWSKAVVSVSDPVPISRKFKIRTAFNQILPAKHKCKTVFIDNSISDTLGTRSIIVYIPSEQQTILYKKNLRLSLKCLIKHYKVAKAIKKKLPAAVKEYNHRITEVQYGDFWQSCIDKPYNSETHGKKVLFVASDNDATSGAFRSMVTLCGLLRDKYNLDIFIALPNEGDGLKLVKEAELKYTIIDSEDWIIRLDTSKKNITSKKHAMKQKNKKAIEALMQIIEDEKFDMVHINTSYSYVGAIAALKTRIPIVWHLREFLEEDQQCRIINKKAGYRLMKKADRLVAISKSIQDKYSGVFNKKLRQIYNGIDCKQFYDTERTILYGNKVIFICVGTVVNYKGQMIAVEAVEKLICIGRFSNFELWIVGTDKTKYADDIHAYISRKELSMNVKFLGRRSDVNELYKASDIALVCSKAEAFGRITVEAMMSGNLVIGADTAGTKEIIEDGVDGLLFTSGNSDSLYEKIKFALDDIDRARELAAHGRQTAIEKFNAERNAEEIHNLYEEIWREKIK